jgi:hypothetical protein
MEVEHLLADARAASSRPFAVRSHFEWLRLNHARSYLVGSFRTIYIHIATTATLYFVLAMIGLPAIGLSTSYRLRTPGGLALGVFNAITFATLLYCFQSLRFPREVCRQIAADLSTRKAGQAQFVSPGAS